MQETLIYRVGEPGFEPGITRSQTEHVSRYTIPRYTTVYQFFLTHGYQRTHG